MHAHSFRSIGIDFTICGTPSTNGTLATVLAMPRSRYQGAFGSETATTTLLGHDQEDMELLAGKMASRLTQRVNKAVFVSRDLEPVTNGSLNQKLQQTAAALAEREIYRVLQSS